MYIFKIYLRTFKGIRKRIPIGDDEDDFMERRSNFRESTKVDSN